MNLSLAILGISLMPLVAPPLTAVAADAERSVREVRFDAGRSGTVLKGSIRGYHYVDHQLNAGAGQTLKAVLRGSNGANYFNILPPGSDAVAMFVGELGDNRFEGILPTEGVYTLRVFLMRSAARRNETSHYSLDVAVTGKALKPLPGSQDAKVAGTRYHASAPIPCTLPYDAATRQCDAGVIRRGTDGTATLEVRAKSFLRRVLFRQGKPVAGDAAQAMSASRRGDVTEIRFGTEERFEIPDALVTGG